MLTNAPPFVSVLFYGLNFIRFISVVSLILVFAGSIYVMATDIVSVKHFRKESKRPGASPEDVLGGCDYIGLRIA